MYTAQTIDTGLGVARFYATGLTSVSIDSNDSQTDPTIFRGIEYRVHLYLDRGPDGWKASREFNSISRPYPDQRTPVSDSAKARIFSAFESAVNAWEQSDPHAAHLFLCLAEFENYERDLQFAQADATRARVLLAEAESRIDAAQRAATDLLNHIRESR